MTDKELRDALAEPFDPRDVKWKPQAVRGNRAMAIAYISARAVMDRLDVTVGVAGWKTEYTLHAAGSVECRLSLRVQGDWVTKADVGSPSEQPDEGDRLKAAYSDALKRAAVQFGIGRYLYNLSAQWVDYDPTSKRFAKTPQLPAFALPTNNAKKAAPAAKAPPEEPFAVAAWRSLLDADPSLDELNGALSDLGKLAPAEKTASWRLIQDYTGRAGLRFDAETKCFFRPQGQGVAS